MMLISSGDPISLHPTPTQSTLPEWVVLINIPIDYGTGNSAYHCWYGVL